MLCLRRHVLLLFFCLQALFSINFFSSLLRLCKCCCSVATVKLGESILTSLWSCLYLWVLWISLLSAFAIHCGNKWEQLDTVSPEANLHLKILEMQQGHPHTVQYNFLSKSQNPDDRQQGDGFKGYKSSTMRLNHKVEQLWLCIRNMLWVTQSSIYK